MCLDSLTKPAQGRLQQNLHGFNARLLRQRARDSYRVAREASADRARGTSALVGGIQSAAAAQGVDLGSGIAVDLVADAAFVASRDIQRIKNNAIMEAWGYRQMSHGEDFQGRQAAYQGKVDAANSVLNFVASYAASSGGG